MRHLKKAAMTNAVVATLPKVLSVYVETRGTIKPATFDMKEHIPKPKDRTEVG